MLLNLIKPNSFSKSQSRKNTVHGIFCLFFFTAMSSLIKAGKACIETHVAMFAIGKICKSDLGEDRFPDPVEVI